MNVVDSDNATNFDCNDEHDYFFTRDKLIEILKDRGVKIDTLRALLQEAVKDGDRLADDIKNSVNPSSYQEDRFGTPSDKCNYFKHITIDAELKAKIEKEGLL